MFPKVFAEPEISIRFVLDGNEFALGDFACNQRILFNFKIIVWHKDIYRIHLPRRDCHS